MFQWPGPVGVPTGPGPAEGDVMLKDCTVTFPGGRVETLRLDERSAAEYRARGAQVDTGESTAKASPAKARKPANKSRSAQNKK